MRISDWSSDVCSSDLTSSPLRQPRSVRHCTPLVSEVSCSSDVHSLRLPSRLTMSLIDGRYEPWNSPPPQGIRGSARPWISSAGIGLRSLQLLNIGPPETGEMAANVSGASQAMRYSNMAPFETPVTQYPAASIL